MQSESNISTAELEAAVDAVGTYDFDRPRSKLVALERLINDTHGDPAARRHLETAMAELLGSKATVAAKQFLCKKLWIMGTDHSVPALSKLLDGSDPVLAEAACYALRTQDSAVAAAALRNALDRTRGVARVAIINVLGDKHDAASATPLIALAAASDGLAAEAAIVALGKIASREALVALTTMHSGPDPTRRLHSAHALLQAGQQLAKRGSTAEAKSIWSRLTGSTEPAPIRRGASLALKG